jgi:hypothetical protein
MKNIYQILTILLCIYVQTADAQMGVNSSGAAPAPSSILDVSSTTKGLLIPRMTSTQRDAIVSPANGLMIYTTNVGEIQVYDGGWKVASRLNVPLLMSGSIATGVVQGFNTGSGPGSYGYASGGGAGGRFEATIGTGASGISTSGYGVTGNSSSNTGVVGNSGTGTGVAGIAGTTGSGVYGTSSSGPGVRGESTSGFGVQGFSPSNHGVLATSTSGTGLYALSSTGIAVSGVTGSNYALYGFSGTNHGLYAEINGGTVAAARIVNNNGTGNAIYANNNSITNAAGRFVNNNADGNALELTGAIRVAGGTNVQTAFKIVSSAGNITSNRIIIPNTTLANSANDILIVTHNYGSGGPYLNKPYGAYWDGANWTIYLEDLTAMPVGVTFNVLIIKQ